MNDIWSDVTILPHETGSRRIESHHLKELIDALKSAGIAKFSKFTVWRFGHHNLLQYPADLAHTSIDDYDVSRVYGKGYLEEQDESSPFLEIDLWAGGHFKNWDWLFHIYGPKFKVDAINSIIQAQIDRWPKTKHSVFHFIIWWVVAWGFTIITSYFIGFFSINWNINRILIIAGLIYITTFSWIVIVLAGKLNPFIWFYRRGGLIEERRPWLRRLSIGFILVILAELFSNIIWKLVLD